MSETRSNRGPVAPAADARLRQIVRRALGDVDVVRVTPLAPDGRAHDETQKAAGYGAPLRLELATAAGPRSVVLHTALPNAFGHDRRADRAAAMLLSNDTFARIPGHVAVLDVGAYTADGGALSLRDAGEFYLLTAYAEGRPYADDLRRIARSGVASDADRSRVRELADYLAELHAEPVHSAQVYRRAIRDLVGSGEGIFGIVDGYPSDAPGAPPARLQAIERRCLEWRFKLEALSPRLRRSHGDFHPFNVLFGPGSELVLLDASRGCAGDPADDVCCMAINYVFFALGHPGAWRSALRELWLDFFARYLQRSQDEQLFAVCAPYLAWRGLVLSNPAWYPDVTREDRERLLSLVERVLDRDRFDPLLADAVFE